MTIRFSAIEGSFTSIEDVCSYLLSQIQNEILKRSKLELLKKNAITYFTNFQFKVSYESFGLEVKRSQRHSLLQSLFREKLLEIWKNLEGNSKGIIIMIDEAEIVEIVPGALMFLREVFSRLGQEKCGYMLVLSGKLAFPDQMSEKFSPLVRFFHPIPLHNFSKEEAHLLLKTKLKQTKINAMKNFLDRVYQESEGHPYVLVAMAYVLYENLPENYNSMEIKYYDALRPKITSYLNSDYFGVMYRKLRPVGQLIVKQIAKLDGETTFSQISKSLRKGKGAISPVLPELIEQGSLMKVGRGKYRLFHLLYKDYLLGAD